MLTSAVGLAGFLALMLAVAGSGARFRPGPWYESLAKPAWTPPNRVFPVAWALIYLTIAIAGWLVWRKAGFGGAVFAFGAYFLQLALNAAWSWLFFGLRRIDLALADVVALWMAIVVNVVAFHGIHAGAAYLLVPYLAWVSYAAALNFAVYRMNR